MNEEFPQDIKDLIDITNQAYYAQSGRERLSGWFGLSYASWLTMPRVLMQQMPDDWQKRMAVLMEEFGDTFPGDWTEGHDLYVAAKKDGKYVTIPGWLNNYRHPNKEKIEQMKKDL